MTTKPDDSPPFDLLRWFAWLSPLVIGVITLGNAWVIAAFLDRQLYLREAETARDFVQSILATENSSPYFDARDDAGLQARFAMTMQHLMAVPGVLRANVFATDGTVIWSSEASLVGQRFVDNDELDKAGRGKLVVHGGRIGEGHHDKQEHRGLDELSEHYVETYIPLLNQGRVLGVIELYKVPRALTEAINAARQEVAVVALFSALFLYLSLFWLIRRADRLIRDQHRRLLHSETLVAVGELASAMAHNIRNPLSSIRSAAELGLDRPEEPCPEQLADIVAEVERIGGAVNELLHYAHMDIVTYDTVDMNEVLEAALSRVAERLSGEKIAWRFERAEKAINVLADRQMLTHVFVSLMANAQESMPQGGDCVLRLVARDGWCEAEIEDRGCGIPAKMADNALRPFFTTKASGLGLGLPLALRIIGRLGGTLRLLPADPVGTRAVVRLPLAKESI